MDSVQLASDLRITEGVLSEENKRIERLRGIDEPTTQDLDNLAYAAQEAERLEKEIIDLKRRMGVKPGPEKQFPIRVDLRIGQAEKDALYRISEQTNEDRSEIIRRLIREADPGF